MDKFKVGDRVEVTSDIASVKKGMTGTIAGKYVRNFYSIKFDKKFAEGHDCQGRCDYGYGYNLMDKYIKLVSHNSSSIHIYTDGTTTTAILKGGKETIRTAQAKCSPDDTYDFNVGAKLAFDRLMGVEVREVKRRAKVGEWVKVINPRNVPKDKGIDAYKKDDILQIIKASYWVMFKNGIAENGKAYALNDDEYVVLENYKPEKTIEDKPLEVIVDGIKYIKADS